MLDANLDSDFLHETHPDTQAFIELVVRQIGHNPRETQHVGNKNV